MAIGRDGPEGWMMKKYLAFGEKMNGVEPAFPVRDLKEEYENRAAWSGPDKTGLYGTLKDRAWHIMGVLEDQYILFDDEGGCAYAPADWFREGNG